MNTLKYFCIELSLGDENTGLELRGRQEEEK